MCKASLLQSNAGLRKCKAFNRIQSLDNFFSNQVDLGWTNSAKGKLSYGKLKKALQKMALAPYAFLMYRSKKGSCANQLSQQGLAVSVKSRIFAGAMQTRAREALRSMLTTVWEAPKPCHNSQQGSALINSSAHPPGRSPSGRFADLHPAMKPPKPRVFSHTAGRYSGWEAIPSAGTVQMSEPHVPWLSKLFVVIGHESGRRSSEVHSNCREYLANLPLATSVLPLWFVVGLQLG